VASGTVDDVIDDSAVWYRQLGTVPPGKQRSERRNNSLQSNGSQCSGISTDERRTSRTLMLEIKLNIIRLGCTVSEIRKRG